MPREHGQIKLTDEELAAFASSQTRCIIGTLDSDGGPWGDCVACAFHDGRFYFRVPRQTRTLRNIEKDDRVCCVIESHPAGADYYTIKGATFHGRAMPAGEAPTAPVDQLRELPDPVTRAPAVEGEIFSVGVDHVVSFDFAKIKRRFER
jgi:hypothetical protein